MIYGHLKHKSQLLGNHLTLQWLINWENIVTVFENCQHWILHTLARRPINKTMLSIIFRAITENSTSKIFDDISHGEREENPRSGYTRIECMTWSGSFKMKPLLRLSQDYDTIVQDRWKHRNEEFEEIHRTVGSKLLILSIEEMVGLLESSHMKSSNYLH